MTVAQSAPALDQPALVAEAGDLDAGAFPEPGRIVFYLASPRIALDINKVNPRLHNQLTFMLAALVKQVDEMPKPRLQEHLTACSQLASRLMNLPPDPDDLYERVDQWYGILRELDSELPLCEYRRNRRQLLQACALEENQEQGHE